MGGYKSCGEAGTARNGSNQCQPGAHACRRAYTIHRSGSNAAECDRRTEFSVPRNGFARPHQT
jgi:hypothetical protein